MSVKRALLSVFDKTGLVEFAQALQNRGIELVASGGTAKAIAAAGIEVTPIERFTGAPEVLGGRVKTLHPKVHGGILADRRNPEHLEELEANDYQTIDLVVCNLYPFQQKLEAGAGHDEMVESIDIGGPTMIRAAAKNADGGVASVVDPGDYPAILEAITDDGLPQSLRRKLAAKAFAHVAQYDQLIAAWLEKSTANDKAHDDKEQGQTVTPPQVLPAFEFHESLRYGENPHQNAAVYRQVAMGEGVAWSEALSGKALSYNNFLDLDAAYRAAFSTSSDHRVAIVKHTNPCGLAEHENQAEAFRRALAGDPVSAFGSIIGLNHPLELDTAKALIDAKLFVECIAAPDFAEGVIDTLSQKKKDLRLVRVPPGDPRPAWHLHRIGGGLLVQQTDLGDPSDLELQVVTKAGLSDSFEDELRFAMGAATTLKSNAIALCKGRSLVGAGTGQMSRVDATAHAITKAGDKVKGSFLASDAFFPFDDCVRMAAEAGVVAIIQPGGSKRDSDSVRACDELGLCMVFTGRRHFRH